MTKKNLLLIFLVLGLAVVYAVWFTNWFRPVTVRISHTSRESRINLRRGNMQPSLIFRVSPQMRFTDVKVVSLADYETNKNVVPVWHLVSESNSIPVQDFTYGEFIRGMHPAFKGVRAEPLQTNVTYRLFVASGKMTGQHDFELK
jgi:hypothetical protein